MFAVAMAGRLSWRDAGTTAVALSQGGEFAFVLLGFAVGAGVMPAGLAAFLTAAVALSMAATPLALLLWEFLSRSRGQQALEPENTYDHDEPVVIVAGFGRFGQVVGRLLTANGLEISILENSVEQIELLRRFGRRVYYGDARRLDLLRAAGVETARLFVVAVEDRETASELVTLVRGTFPHIKVLARAFDRRHAYELLDLGADVVERETFEGGLALGGEALKALGWRAYRAERATRLFRRHDERLLDLLRPVWRDEERFAIASRESSPNMDELLHADLDLLQANPSDDGWDVSARYSEEAGKPAASRS
jgi:glutathione-regulated potassium-efflux system ancillary protein KefC/glutathione-regulated potassium-efflux system protein KefB